MSLHMISLAYRVIRLTNVDQKYYRIDPNCDYGSLTSLLSRADQTIDTEQIAE